MYKNNFLTNYSKNKFIDEIKRALTNCMSFSLSVSFIKKVGLILIEKEIEEARKTFQKVFGAKRSYGFILVTVII